MGGTVYSVGEEIIALDWVSLSLSVLARTRASALAEGCVSLTLPGNDTGFFFLSGDFYSLDTHTWTRFARPEPAFNMFSLDNVPVILGIATLDPTSGCDDDDDDSEGAGCHPTRMLTGDNRVVQFNLQSNSWTNIAYLGNTFYTFHYKYHVSAQHNFSEAGTIIISHSSRGGLGPQHSMQFILNGF